MKHRNGPKRATYLNWKSQNEFLEVLSSFVNEQHIFSEFESAQFYSAIADTTPDISHPDQLSVVLRCLLPSTVTCECLVDMKEMGTA